MEDGGDTADSLISPDLDEEMEISEEDVGYMKNLLHVVRWRRDCDICCRALMVEIQDPESELEGPVYQHGCVSS